MTKKEISASLLIELKKIGFKDDQWKTWEICCIDPVAAEAAEKNIVAETIIANIGTTARKTNCPIAIIQGGNQDILNYFMHWGITPYKEFLLKIVENSNPIEKCMP
jgi:hypothetical protein